jgi:type IV conjugative transfer system protein TraE
MERQTLANKVPALIRQRNLVSTLAALMIIANLFLCITLFRNRTTIVILPSEISGSYRIYGNKVNDIYLKDRANEIIKTILNLTPNNLENMYEVILKNAPPIHHFELKKALNKIGKEILGRNISIAFYPISTEVDTDNLVAEIEGEFYSIFGGKAIQSSKSYHLKFIYSGNYLLLTEFYEINNEEENEAE